MLIFFEDIISNILFTDLWNWRFSFHSSSSSIDIELSNARILLSSLLLFRQQWNRTQRFVPSEFGADPDKAQISDMDMGFYKKKAEIRRLIESEGIPHTYISCNFFMTYLLPSLVQPGSKIPPRDGVKIYGNGNCKAVFVKESDVAVFTIATIDDPRTLNRVLYLRPPGNVVSMNDLVELWEMKIAQKLEKDYVTEEMLLKNIQDMPYPANMELIFIYSAFIKGDHTYFNLEENGFDATILYPDVKYTTVSQFLDTLL